MGAQLFRGTGSTALEGPVGHDCVVPLEFGRYADVFGTLDVRRGDPSPSGRGQGEGLDVDSSLPVIGLGGSTLSSLRFSADKVAKCIVALRRVAPVLSFHPDSSAPVPIAAKENVTFEPSPCPLPEGGGCLSFS